MIFLGKHTIQKHKWTLKVDKDYLREEGVGGKGLATKKK